MTGVPLLALAHVEEHGLAVEGLDLGGVQLVDLASDAADDLRPGRAHAISVLRKADRVSNTSGRIAPSRLGSRPGSNRRPLLPMNVAECARARSSRRSSRSIRRSSPARRSSPR